MRWQHSFDSDMKGLNLTRAQAEAHQAKHGFRITADNADRIIKTVDKLLAKPRMNKTEAEYALILEAMKRRGEIQRYEYEGITLRWLVGKKIVKYTPDFVVFTNPPLAGLQPRGFNLIEVKGGYVGGKFERAVERFRHATTYWPQFAFELWQKKQGQWRRIH